MKMSGCCPIRWAARKPPWLPPTTATLHASKRGRHFSDDDDGDDDDDDDDDTVVLVRARAV